MQILDDGSCLFHDRLEIGGEGTDLFTVGAAWLVEVVSLKSGDFYFITHQGELRPLTRRFGIYYSPFSIVQTASRDFSGDVFGVGSYSAVPGLPEESMIFDTEREEPFTSAADALQFVSAAGNAKWVDLNRSPSRLSLETKQLIDQNYSDPLSIARLAERLNVSHSHLSRRFKLDYLLSPKDYVHRLRTAEARYKLLKGDKIVDVSADVGYGDLSRFYKQFRKGMGSPPGSCRD